jgi:CO/xanthine dehydrogenase Mo-binding subunit
VRAEGAPANAKLYNNLFWGKAQGTGGSTAIANSFAQLRQAGATARAMLVAAAAQQQYVRRVLVDLRRARLLVGPLNLNRHIAKLSGEELFASIRLAVVAAFRTNELKYFEELAAYNALHIRVFTDGVLAEQWLNETQPSMAAAS